MYFFVYIKEYLGIYAPTSPDKKINFTLNSIFYKVIVCIRHDDDEVTLRTMDVIVPKYITSMLRTEGYIQCYVINFARRK